MKLNQLLKLCLITVFFVLNKNLCAPGDSVAVAVAQTTTLPQAASAESKSKQTTQNQTPEVAAGTRRGAGVYDAKTEKLLSKLTVAERAYLEANPGAVARFVKQKEEEFEEGKRRGDGAIPSQKTVVATSSKKETRVDQSDTVAVSKTDKTKEAKEQAKKALKEDIKNFDKQVLAAMKQNQEKITAASQNLKKNQKDLKNLQALRDGEAAFLNQVNQAIVEAKAAASQMQKKLDQLKKQEGQLSIQDPKIKELQDKLAAAKQEEQNLATAKQQAKQNYDQANKSLESAKQKLSAAQDKYKELKQNSDQLKKDLIDAKKAAESNKLKLEKISKDLKDAEAEATVVSDDATLIRNQIDNKTKLRKEKIERQNSIDRKIKKLDEQISNLEDILNQEFDFEIVDLNAVAEEGIPPLTAYQPDPLPTLDPEPGSFSEKAPDKPKGLSQFSPPKIGFLIRPAKEKSSLVPVADPGARVDGQTDLVLMPINLSNKLIISRPKTATKQTFKIQLEKWPTAISAASADPELNLVMPSPINFSSDQTDLNQGAVQPPTLSAYPLPAELIYEDIFKDAQKIDSLNLPIPDFEQVSPAFESLSDVANLDPLVNLVKQFVELSRQQYELQKKLKDLNPKNFNFNMENGLTISGKNTPEKVPFAFMENITKPEGRLTVEYQERTNSKKILISTSLRKDQIDVDLPPSERSGSFLTVILKDFGPAVFYESGKIDSIFTQQHKDKTKKKTISKIESPDAKEKGTKDQLDEDRGFLWTSVKQWSNDESLWLAWVNRKVSSSMPLDPLKITKITEIPQMSSNPEFARVALIGWIYPELIRVINKAPSNLFASYSALTALINTLQTIKRLFDDKNLSHEDFAIDVLKPILCDKKILEVDENKNVVSLKYSFDGGSVFNKHFLPEFFVLGGLALGNLQDNQNLPDGKNWNSVFADKTTKDWKAVVSANSSDDFEKKAKIAYDQALTEIYDNIQATKVEIEKILGERAPSMQEVAAKINTMIADKKGLFQKEQEVLDALEVINTGLSQILADCTIKTKNDAKLQKFHDGCKYDFGLIGTTFKMDPTKKSSDVAVDFGLLITKADELPKLVQSFQAKLQKEAAAKAQTEIASLLKRFSVVDTTLQAFLTKYKAELLGQPQARDAILSQQQNIKSAFSEITKALKKSELPTQNFKKSLQDGISSLGNAISDATSMVDVFLEAKKNKHAALLKLQQAATSKVSVELEQIKKSWEAQQVKISSLQQQSMSMPDFLKSLNDIYQNVEKKLTKAYLSFNSISGKPLPNPLHANLPTIDSLQALHQFVTGLAPLVQADLQKVADFKKDLKQFEMSKKAMIQEANLALAEINNQQRSLRDLAQELQDYANSNPDLKIESSWQTYQPLLQSILNNLNQGVLAITSAVTKAQSQPTNFAANIPSLQAMDDLIIQIQKVIQNAEQALSTMQSFMSQKSNNLNTLQQAVADLVTEVGGMVDNSMQRIQPSINWFGANVADVEVNGVRPAALNLQPFFTSFENEWLILKSSLEPNKIKTFSVNQLKNQIQLLEQIKNACLQNSQALDVFLPQLETLYQRQQSLILKQSSSAQDQLKAAITKLKSIINRPPENVFFYRSNKLNVNPSAEELKLAQDRLIQWVWDREFKDSQSSKVVGSLGSEIDRYEKAKNYSSDELTMIADGIEKWAIAVGDFYKVLEEKASKDKALLISKVEYQNYLTEKKAEEQKIEKKHAGKMVFFNQKKNLFGNKLVFAIDDFSRIEDLILQSDIDQVKNLYQAIKATSDQYFDNPNNPLSLIQDIQKYYQVSAKLADLAEELKTLFSKSLNLNRLNQQEEKILKSQKAEIDGYLAAFSSLQQSWQSRQNEIAEHQKINEQKETEFRKYTEKEEAADLAKIFAKFNNEKKMIEYNQEQARKKKEHENAQKAAQRQMVEKNEATKRQKLLENRNLWEKKAQEFKLQQMTALRALTKIIQERKSLVEQKNSLNKEIEDLGKDLDLLDINNAANQKKALELKNKITNLKAQKDIYEKRQVDLENNVKKITTAQAANDEKMKKLDLDIQALADDVAKKELIVNQEAAKVEELQNQIKNAGKKTSFIKKELNTLLIADQKRLDELNLVRAKKAELEQAIGQNAQKIQQLQELAAQAKDPAVYDKQIAALQAKIKLDEEAIPELNQNGQKMYDLLSPEAKAQLELSKTQAQ